MIHRVRGPSAPNARDDLPYEYRLVRKACRDSGAGYYVRSVLGATPGRGAQGRSSCGNRAREDDGSRLAGTHSARRAHVVGRPTGGIAASFSNSQRYLSAANGPRRRTGHCFSDPSRCRRRQRGKAGLLGARSRVLSTGGQWSSLLESSAPLRL